MKKLMGVIITLAMFAGAALAQPDTLWTSTFRLAGIDCVKTVLVMPDGGFVVGGMSESFATHTLDFWIMRLDSTCDSLWCRWYGGDQPDRGYGVCQTTDGGFVIGGMGGSFGALSADFWAVKTDADGDSLWSRLFRRDGIQIAYSVAATNDGGCVLAGRVNEEGNPCAFSLLRLAADGDSLWFRTFLRRDAHCYWVNQTMDGGFVMAGTEGYGWGGGNFWIIRTDSLGDSLWTRSIGGYGGMIAAAGYETAGGDYVLAGSGYSTSTNSRDFILTKVSASGDSLWQHTYHRRNEMALALAPAPDGGFLLGGWSGRDDYDSTDIWIVRTDSVGNELWNRTYGGSGYEVATSIQPLPDGGFIVAGITSSFNAWVCDPYLIRIAADGTTISEEHRSLPSSFALAQNSPNPFNSQTRITFNLPQPGQVSLRLFDILGRERAVLASGMMNVGRHDVDLNGNDLPSGVYIYRLEANGQSLSRKMVLLK